MRKPSPDGGLDAGRPDAGYSPRPDGGAILPAADEEVSLPLGADAIQFIIEVDAAPQVLDLHFSVDTTSSMDGEINELQRELRETAIRELSERIESVAFGVSAFEDFPRDPFGSDGEGTDAPPDSPFELLTPVTSNLDRVAIAVSRLDQPLGYGGDHPESDGEALWQIATGEGYELNGATLIEPFSGIAAPGGGKAGGVGFREGALRVVLHVTDAPSHDPSDYEPLFVGTHSMAEASDALAMLGCKVVGIVSAACDEMTSDDCDPSRYLQTRDGLEQAAIRTGALAPESSPGQCAHGIDGSDVPSVDGQCPLVFNVSPKGEGLSRTLVDGIIALVDGTRFNVVSGVVSDDPVGFVESVTPLALPQPSDAESPRIEDLLPSGEPDGKTDSFVDVRAKARVGFEISLRNHHIAATDVEQRFRAIVQIIGDGLILKQRVFRIIVPASDVLVPPPEDDAG